MKKVPFIHCLCAILALTNSPCPAGSVDVQDLVHRCFNYMRGKASVALVDMTIHRPDWERTVTIKAWTQGERNSLFTILAPAKDKGNGTLKKGREMWMYNPKVNRIIKVPPSMMSQSWMGSDFSNNDLAKSDSILHDYNHTITGSEMRDGTIVYHITSMPKPGAPVVWGMQKLHIREDGIYLMEEFYDEDEELVKTLSFEELEMIDGKLYPRLMRMKKADNPGEYTVVRYRELSFKDHLSDSLFTLSSLKTPRR